MSSMETSAMSRNRTMPTHYVGIGASAGGLEAIENFFANMAPDSGMAFIVVQHLSPDYKSLMVELLSKRTQMTVLRAENNQVIEANTVYLIPPKHNLTIFHGSLLLEPQRSQGLNLPIDIFLRSLADDQEERAIGVVLSGTGSDGMHGIRAIKENDGLVIVQSPETARFDGMPNSAISTGIADFILPPDQMGPTLLSYAKHPNASRSYASREITLEEDWLPRVLAHLRREKKLDFACYKPTTVVRRVQRRMTINQIQDPEDYVRLLETIPQEIDNLYRDLLIGVTNFFRNPEAFGALRDNYLATLLEDCRDRELRCWVAGCSTGEEAYTLAILIRELQNELGLRTRVKIFATDIDSEALYRAGNGLFPQSIAADLSSEFLARYFVSQPDGFKVTHNLREMVVFARHNLIKDPPFTKIDFVSCRNLLIYLQPVLQRKVLEKFNFSLNSGGLLMLGTSETIGELDSHFETLDAKQRIYRSRGHRLDILPRLELQANEPYRRPLERERWRGELDIAEGPLRLLEKVLAEAAGDYLPLTLVVNDRQELIHSTGDCGDLLRIPPGKAANDVVKMAHPDLSIPLSTALQKVQQTRREVVYGNVRLRVRDEARSYTLRIKPLSSVRHVQPLFAVYLINEPTAGAVRDAAAKPYDPEQEAHQRILDLEQELMFSRENLQATIEELETSNEELQATNEELMASNEELQSTNEELQSVNEELFTVNAEYQKKITELTEITNDLDNLLTATEIGTLFLDENLDVRKFTPLISQVLNLRPADIGRQVIEVTHRLREIDLVAAITRVQQIGEPLRMEVSNVDGVWFLMQILPYLVSGREQSGVVVTFVDISRIKQAENAQSMADANYQLLLDNIPSGVALYEVAGKDDAAELEFVCLDVNPSFERITSLTRQQLIGRKLDQQPNLCPEEIQRRRMAFTTVIRTGSPVNLDCSCAHRPEGCHIFAYRLGRRRIVAVIAAAVDGNESVDTQLSDRAQEA